MRTTFVQAFHLSRFVKIHPHVTFNQDSCINSRSTKIVSILKEKNGLADYFANHFIETDIAIIQSLFDQTNQLVQHQSISTTTKPIATTLMTECQHSNTGFESYATKFWQQTHIVLYTFKFLDPTFLNICSIISANWMYYAFNPVSAICLKINKNQLPKLFKV